MMTGSFTRRNMLQGMGLAALGLATGATGALPQSGKYGKWWRGNLHMHTFWSDGSAFPEQAVDVYKNQLGYDFIALSDHNIFPENLDEWRVVHATAGGWPPKISQPYFDLYKERFGKEIDSRTNDKGEQEVRLRAFHEVKAMFEEPGKFLLMPGVEITQKTGEVDVHVNYVNIPENLPRLKGGPLVTREKLPATELIAENIRDVTALAEKHKLPTLVMVNHPQWRYLDIKPENMIDNPDLRFFEVCNGGSAFPPPDAYPVRTNDHLWDVVNSFRVLKGMPLIFGTASDDTHHYYNTPHGKIGRLGLDYIVVRSNELTAAALLSAMHQGDFYSSTGVTLDNIEFDPVKRQLHVKVLAKEDVQYKIRFFTTRNKFDQRFQLLEIPGVKGHGARSYPVYSDEIGRIARTVNGSEGTYTMKSSDLYVRARIDSAESCGYKRHFHPEKKVAWTQPFGA